MKGNIGVVITDGVGFRNFILSDFLKELELNYNEVYIYSCLPKEVYSGFITKAKVVELEVFPDTFRSWFFMKLKEIAHLNLHRKNNFGIQDNYNVNRSKSKTPRGYAVRLIYAITRVLHSEAWIQRFQKLQNKSFKNHRITKDYIKLLERDKVDFMFFTHQRPAYISPMIYASKERGITTGTFIFSWDNLASKGRMAGDFDTYFVWSKLMKSELLHFYKRIKEPQVHVIGTPQFEPYTLDRYATDKGDFDKKFGINPKEKTICFSCGDVSTSRNDNIYIETIAEAISNNIIPKTTNLLVRTSPAETDERFAYLREKYPFIIWNVPEWKLSRQGHQEQWSQRIPTVEDVKTLRSVLQYSDVFVNMCSTMSLDAMCFNKPVINPVFGNKQNGLYDDQRFLNYLHYKRVAESGAVAIVKDKEQLVNGILTVLEQSAIRLEAQQKLLKVQVSHQLEGTSARIVNAIKTYTN